MFEEHYKHAPKCNLMKYFIEKEPSLVKKVNYDDH